MSRISETSQQMGEKIRDMGAQAKGMAQEQLQHLRESASTYYEQGRQKAVQWSHDLEDYVREQPIKSVLIAAGVGALLGLLWRRM